MRTTRIDVEGDAKDRFASFSRKRGSQMIALEIICSDNHRMIYAKADSLDDQWEKAEYIQEILDGRRGTSDQINRYLDLIERLAD